MKASPEETAALREKATKDHHALLVALHGELVRRGWTEIGEIPAAIDLWARSPDGGQRVIFEAKTIGAANEADQVRSAFAQLHEYRYFHGAPDDRLCLVTNGPIGDGRTRFLEAAGICVIWIDGERVQPGGKLAGAWLAALL